MNKGCIFVKVLELFDLLQEEIEHGSSVPLSKKKMLDPDALLDILDEIREALPDELRQAQVLKDERERILNDAQREAAKMLGDTQDRMQSLITEHEITQRAQQRAQEILNASEENAKEIYTGAINYADDILGELEDYMSKYQMAVGDYLDHVRANRASLVSKDPDREQQ